MTTGLIIVVSLMVGVALGITISALMHMASDQDD